MLMKPLIVQVKLGKAWIPFKPVKDKESAKAQIASITSRAPGAFVRVVNLDGVEVYHNEPSVTLKKVRKSKPRKYMA